MTDIKRMERPTDLICEKCGKPMVIKWGKHGSFIACTGYPECTNTRELTVDLPESKGRSTEQDETEYCDNCGRPMVLKKGRFGQFLACSGYPDCKTTKQLGEAQKPQGRAARRKVPAVRQQAGQEVRALRRVRGVQQLSQVQVRQAEDHRREVPQLLRRRSGGAALQARQDVLRLQPLSGLRFRGLGQADSGEVSGLRRQLPDREIPEVRSGGAVPQRRVQVQEADRGTPLA